MRFALLTLSALCLVATPSMAQQAVEAAYRAALEQSPTPVTLASEQAQWRLARADVSAAEFEDMDRMQLEQLTASRDRDGQIRRGRIALANLATTCFDTGIEPCVPTTSGAVLMADGTPVYFQIQRGEGDAEGTTAVLLLAGEADALAPVAWLYDGAYYEPPEIYQVDGEASTYIGIRGYGAGTAASYDGGLFRWNGAGKPLDEIDAVSWQDELPGRLPKGLEIWKGFSFDWSSMFASSPLWQADDANCCATGGSVNVSLEVKGDRLSIVDVASTDLILDVASTVQPAVLAWVSRRVGCGHWASEEGYDADRRAEIAKAMADLSCDTVDADEASLRTVNADNPVTLALMDRANVY